MRVFLAKDGDCHWYLVRAERREDWCKWVESGDEDCPDYAQMIGGTPSSIEFEVPGLNDEKVERRECVPTCLAWDIRCAILTHPRPSQPRSRPARENAVHKPLNHLC
jgi:hypothetical protein